MAEEQARAMAARDKLDHSVTRDFSDRLRAKGYNAQRGGGEHLRRLPHAGRSLLRLARFAAAPANMLLNGATRIGIAAV